MTPIHFPIWQNLIIFSLAGAAIWYAGIRLERYASVIALRTGLTAAFTGMLLVAAATSLPEAATTVSAALLGNAKLAVSNLLGGVILQTAILALADKLTRVRGALTSFNVEFILLIEGIGLIVIIQVVTLGMTSNLRVSMGGLDIWTIGVIAVYMLILRSTYTYQHNPRWKPVELEEEYKEMEAVEDRALADKSLKKIYAYFALASCVVFAAGWAAAVTADAIAIQTGLGSTFIGATILATATSLPEISVTLAACRQGSYSLAISNIFGTNAVDVSFLFLADVFYRGGPILHNVPPQDVFLAVLGTIATCVYIWGILERRGRAIWGLGYDSVVVIVLYLFGLIVLYRMR